MGKHQMGGSKIIFSKKYPNKIVNGIGVVYSYLWNCISYPNAVPYVLPRSWAAGYHLTSGSAIVTTVKGHWANIAITLRGDVFIKLDVWR